MSAETGEKCLDIKAVGRTTGHRGQHTGLGRAGPLVVTLVVDGLLASACGGGGSSGLGVASVGATSSTTGPAAASAAASQGGIGTANDNQAVAYANSMRSRGITDFPDPSTRGEFISQHGELNGQSVDTTSPQYAPANKACEHLLPNGGQRTPVEQRQALDPLLRLIQCMRIHGAPNMADPTTSSGGVAIRPPAGVCPSSPQFKAALQACRSFQLGAVG
jgi:hypothetical protein